MSPLERVIPLKEIAKIRVECQKCHTTASFPVRGWTHGNVGESCPFCLHPWGDQIQRIFLDITKSLERSGEVKTCVISLELDEAF